MKTKKPCRQLKGTLLWTPGDTRALPLGIWCWNGSSSAFLFYRPFLSRVGLESSPPKLQRLLEEFRKCHGDVNTLLRHLLGTERVERISKNTWGHVKFYFSLRMAGGRVKAEEGGQPRVKEKSGRWRGPECHSNRCRDRLKEVTKAEKKCPEEKGCLTEDGTEDAQKRKIRLVCKDMLGRQGEADWGSWPS